MDAVIGVGRGIMRCLSENGKTWIHVTTWLVAGLGIKNIVRESLDGEMAGSVVVRGS